MNVMAVASLEIFTLLPLNPCGDSATLRWFSSLIMSSLTNATKVKVVGKFTFTCSYQMMV